MAQYATIEAMERHRGADLVRKISDKRRTGARDDAALVDAIERASSLADAHIEKKYRVPLVKPPGFLVEKIIDIAIYSLAADMTVGTEEFRRRYDDAIKLLKDIAKGEISLAGEAPASSVTDPVTGAEGSRGVMTIARERHFTRKTEIL